VNRIDWEEYFIEITKLVSQRSSCLSRQVGAILVKEKRILATGYNGSPSKIENCMEKGECLRKGSKSGENLNECMAVHAELNAILQMARYGVSCEDAVLYVTTKPCASCMKAIIQSGIIKVVYIEDYDSPLTDKLVELSGIKCIQYKEKNKGE
jgi:dCMP deaminase